MVNLDSVLYGLRCLLDNTFGECEKCPYSNDDGCIEAIVSEALELLSKEKDYSVVPKPLGGDDFACTCCNMHVDILNSYCWNCGRMLNWEPVLREPTKEEG